MKRKILVTLLILLVAVCSLGLFACGDDSNKNGGGNNGGGGVQFSEYFNFDNVTVNSTMTQTITSSNNPSNPDVMEIEETFKANGNKWTYISHDATVITGGPSYDLTVYFDGTNTYVSKYDSIQDEYVENVNDESYKSKGEYFFTYVNMIPSYEDEFVEASTGVYTADELSIYGVYDISDASVTVVDGNLSSIAFTLTTQGDNYTMTQVYSYTFSNWETTVVE